MASFNYKKYLPHLLIIGAFLIISWMYAYPALSGKELAQGDNISWKGMSHEATVEYERTGKPVLWSNSMFGGMPTYTFYMGRTANYVAYIEQAIQAILPKPAYFFFIAMLGFYLLMQVLGINRWLSAIGAFAYAFATYNPGIIAAGHDTKMLSMGYLPGVLAGIMLIYRGRWLPGMALTGITFALMFQNQHVQILFYMGIILLGLACGLLYIAVKEGKLKQFVIASALTLVTLALGASPTLPQFLSTLEYSKMSTRGGHSELTLNHDKNKTTGGLDKDYAFMWSNSPGETFCLLVPGLYGGSSSEPAGTSSNTYERLTSLGVPEESAEQFVAHLPLYWGPQRFLAGPFYIGAAICFLFMLGMLVVRSPHKWWIAALCFLAIVMSWGDNFRGFNYFLFDTVPVLNKLRTPSMVLVIPQLLFPVIACWGLHDILNGKISREELWKKTRLSLIVTGGLCLVLAIGSRMFFDFRGTRHNEATDERLLQGYTQQLSGRQQDPAAIAQAKESAAKVLSAVHDDRMAMATKSGLVSALYIAMAGGLIWAYSRNKIKGQYLIGGLALVVAIDLIPIAWRYLNEQNYVDPETYAESFNPRPADAQILQDKDPYYRVLDVTKDVYNDATQAYFHKCIGGYNPAKMEIYQDLIDVHMRGQDFNAQVLNMLNTKYFIVPGPQGGAEVIPNANASGNAWFVSGVKQVNTADEEILSLKAAKLGDTAQNAGGDFNPKETAIVRNTFASQLQGLQPGRDSGAQVRLAQYGLNDISYVYSNPREGLAVFSDIWYPYGWKAYVDGKELPIIRANYVLRALRLPPGNNKRIDFKFHPTKFYTGNTIAGISSLLLYALLIGAIVYAVRREKGEEGTENEAAVADVPADEKQPARSKK